MHPSTILLTLAALASGSAVANPQRLVVVNGQRLDDAQIAWLEQRHCAPIPNGSYWLDPRNGAWGYAGRPRAQGVLGAPCTASERRSLSERGLLYRPGEIINGR